MLVILPGKVRSKGRYLRRSGGDGVSGGYPRRAYAAVLQVVPIHLHRKSNTHNSAVRCMPDCTKT